jgi:hypothetical protein
MSSSSRSVRAALGAGALLLGLAPAARAANWEFLPRLEAGATYNDNYRLAEGGAGKINVYGPYINAQLSASLLSPRAKLEIVPRIYSTYFPTDHADQSTNGYLDIDGNYRTLRSVLSGLAQFSDETVIYSELLPATFPGVGLGEVTPGLGGGRVAVRNRRRLENLAPRYTYDLTQRAHLNLQANYLHVSFNKSLIQQVGFSDYSGGAGLSYEVTPRSTLAVSALSSHFTPQVGINTANQYSGQVRWDFTESQIVHFYARVGATHTQTNVTAGTVGTTGATGGAGVDLRYAITEFTIDAIHTVAPSEAGSEVTDDELRFRLLHAFDPLLSGFVAARAVRLRGVSNQPGLAIQGEDYATGEAGVDYQVTQSYRLEVAYDYTRQTFQGEPSASSNAVQLSVIYQPLSRYEPLPEFTGIPREP